MLTPEKIRADVRALAIPDGATVLMHTSLRAIGKIEGGAEALLDVLIDEICTRGGLFCVPTHTWDNLGGSGYTLDVVRHGSCLGTFPNIALRDGRGLRTENPTHSMVIFGNRERAINFARGELRVKTPTSPDSCYGRLLTENGYVLLVGVTQNRNTYLHSVEEMLGFPNRVDKSPTAISVKRASGEEYHGEIYLFDHSVHGDVSNKFHLYEPALRAFGAIKDYKIGDAAVQLCDAGIIKDALTALWDRSGGIDPLTLGDEIPSEMYE